MNDMAAYYTPDPEIGLFGGRWEHDPATHVLRWVQERQPAPMPAEPVLPLCKWCSDECYKASRSACKRRSITKRGRAKGKCQDCGDATSAVNKTRCKPCALSYRSDGKWVGPQRATEAA